MIRGRGRGRLFVYDVAEAIKSTQTDQHKETQNDRISSSITSLPRPKSPGREIQMWTPRINTPRITTNSGLQSFDEKLVTLTDEQSLLPLVIDVLNGSDCTSETVVQMIGIVLDRCIWSPDISRKFASIMCLLTKHKVFGGDIKRVTFNTLEEFYNSRDTLMTSKKYGIGTFRNCVNLTGEIYLRYTFHEKRIEVLADPMMQYLKMLQTSSDPEDLKILCQQVCWSGKELAKKHSLMLGELLVEMRRSLIKPAGYTTMARYWILLCIDVVQCNYNPLSHELKKFYIDALGEKYFASIIPQPSSIQETYTADYCSLIKNNFDESF